ncbi:hypothetical protein Bbelb_233450 [Branchiostoma belcheri]|nr:hypothetical protein Bbelb_233450 [Branchiostoma belcheri]
MGHNRTQATPADTNRSTTDLRHNIVHTGFLIPATVEEPNSNSSIGQEQAIEALVLLADFIRDSIDTANHKQGQQLSDHKLNQAKRQSQDRKSSWVETSRQDNIEQEKRLKKGPPSCLRVGDYGGILENQMLAYLAYVSVTASNLPQTLV